MYEIRKDVFLRMRHFGHAKPRNIECEDATRRRSITLSPSSLSAPMLKIASPCQADHTASRPSSKGRRDGSSGAFPVLPLIGDMQTNAGFRR
jgi:hypothetical protein